MYYKVAKSELDDQSINDYILSSITSPPPPTCPGNWYLLCGEHWFLYDREHSLNVFWTSMNDEAIQSATSHKHLYHVGLINSQQQGLWRGLCPYQLKATLTFNDMFLNSPTVFLQPQTIHWRLGTTSCMGFAKTATGFGTLMTSLATSS
jgi:hypothetical protein